MEHAAMLRYAEVIVGVAAFVAAFTVFKRWRRFIVLVALAAGSGYLIAARSVHLGIDLAGGAELRYRFDTSRLERELTQYRQWLAELGDPAALDAKKKRIQDLDNRIKVEPNKLRREELEEEKSPLLLATDKARLDESISITQEKIRHHTSEAIEVVRRRIDPTGIKEISVAALGSDRVLMRLPFRKPEASSTAGRTEKERMEAARKEFLDNILAIKSKIETQGVLRFHLVIEDVERIRRAERAFQALEPVQKDYLYAVNEDVYKEAAAKAKTLGKDLFDLGYIRQARDKDRKKGPPAPLLLKREQLADGTIIAQASASIGDEGPQVNMSFTAHGSREFYNLTSRHQKERMAIVLDNVVESAPVIKEPISGHGRISGSFTMPEAKLLSEVLSAGSLPFQMVFESEYLIGPGLGQDSVDKGIYSVIVASILVFAFMAAYYLGGGLVADVALALNMLLLFAGLSLFNATLTLPGIAGIALTVGMAVDANILIFERIREEKARGRTLKLAVQAGHERAFVTIMDSQTTTLITAVILYYVGTGPVKGFAVTLSMGIIANLFCALYVCKHMLEFLVAKNILRDFKMLRVVGETKFPFVQLRWAAFALSALMVAGGVWAFATHKQKYGIDFTGGTRMLVKYAAEAKTEDVRGQVAKAAMMLSNERKQAADRFASQAAEAGGSGQAERAAQLRASAVNYAASARTIASESRTMDINAFEPTGPGRSTTFTMITGMVHESNDGTPDDIEAFKGYLRQVTAGALHAEDPFPSTESIGTAVSHELQSQAFWAVLFSLGAIFLYILVRFEFNVSFGIGAVIALAHDVIIAAGAMCLMDKLNLMNMKIDIVAVAALLTIVGYSLNDTIVVFDRIRENRRASRNLPWGDVVNAAINQTLSRTFLTSFTTLLATAVLFVAGGERIQGFAFAMTIGVTVGTYSSVFVASPIVVQWMKWRSAKGKVAPQQA